MGRVPEGRYRLLGTAARGTEAARSTVVVNSTTDRRAPARTIESMRPTTCIASSADAQFVQIITMASMSNLADTGAGSRTSIVQYRQSQLDVMGGSE